MTGIDDLLTAARNAADAGNVLVARGYLRRASRVAPERLDVWRELLAVTDLPVDRVRCLEQIVALDAADSGAAEELARLRDELGSQASPAPVDAGTDAPAPDASTGNAIGHGPTTHQEPPLLQRSPQGSPLFTPPQGRPTPPPRRSPLPDTTPRLECVYSESKLFGFSMIRQESSAREPQETSWRVSPSSSSLAVPKKSVLQHVLPQTDQCPPVAGAPDPVGPVVPPPVTGAPPPEFPAEDAEPAAEHSGPVQGVGQLCAVGVVDL